MDTECFYFELIDLISTAVFRLIVPRKRDKDNGTFIEVYSDKDFLTVLDGTRLSTSEVAEKIDCHRTTAYEKLRSMEESGLVVSTKAGNTLIWEVADG
jgi:predicted transcriptional regulator